jgi:heterodisulfide reductase subunit C
LFLASDTISKSSLCVQCGRCSSGCPVAFESLHTPRRIIRFLQLGQVETACRSPFLWYCAMCQACTVRCPRGVDVSETVLSLRRLGIEKGWIVKDLWYYKIFTEMIEKKGKIQELRLGLAAALHKGSLHPIEDALLLFRLWRRGKI